MSSLSYVTYTGDGTTTDYTFPFSYLSQSDVYVFVNGVSTTFTWLNASAIRVAAPVSGATIQIRRITQTDAVPVNFTDGSVLLESDLDTLAQYTLYQAQESAGLASSITNVIDLIAGLGSGGMPGLVSIDRFSGTGSLTTFTLSISPTSGHNTDVYLDGIYQNHNTFAVVGDTLTFTEAPRAGTDNIEVQVMVALGLTGDGSNLISYTPAGTGAVATTVQAKLRESVSVFDFMTAAEIAAVVAGTGDASIGIQKALDSDYKNIYFPPGLYRLASPLLIKNQASSFGKTLYGNKSQTYLIPVAGLETAIDILKGADGALSMVIKDIRFSGEGAYTGWCIRALGTGTLIDSRIEGCWSGSGTLSAGFFYGKTVFSSFINNVHELSKVFARCTLASAASFINNKFFDVYDEQFYFDGTSASNGIVIDGVNVNAHNRGSFIKAVNTSNLIVSNVDYQAGTTLVDSGQYCAFMELDSSTATVSNFRIISSTVAGYVTANKVTAGFKSTNSTFSITNGYATYVEVLEQLYGSVDGYISGVKMSYGGTAVNVNASAAGSHRLLNNSFSNLTKKVMTMPSVNAVTHIIDGNNLYNSNTSAATYCWYFYSTGKILFKNNICEMTANMTQWFSIDSGNSDLVTISGNIFTGTPSAGSSFVGGNLYKATADNIGLKGITGTYSATAAPTVGTYAVGDRVVNSNAVVGQPKAWACTVAGTPGTWVSEGVL